MGPLLGVGDEIGWLTPTSAAKLLACPVSVTRLSIGDRPQPPTSIPTNAGTLAHLAVQRWVDSDGWRDGAGPELLADHFKREADNLGITVEQLADGRMTESRLMAQGPKLAAAIRSFAGSNGSVFTERSMYDDVNRLWGTIDLLVEGDQGVIVIDLKSGADAAKGSLPDGIRNQLLHYALLVRADHEETPTALAVFSLRRGLRVMETAIGEMDSLLTRINLARQAWMVGNRPAEPSPDQCRYCGRRLSCDPHWAAIDEWEEPDATQGILRRVELAANGSSALTLANNVWISDVPGEMASHLDVGQVLRGARIRRSRREVDSEGQTNWYATERSVFETLAAEHVSE